MWKFLAKLWIKLNGWQIIGSIPEGINKAVVIAAPHTSNVDFFYSRSAFYMLGIPLKFAIKKEIIEGPLGPLLKSMGAIPIDRNRVSKGKHNSYVDQMIRYLRENEQIMIMIAPEGTRKYVEKWKSGFYYIARGAEVPVILGYLDYKKKHAGVGPIYYPGEDLNAEMEKIQSFYRKVTARHPERTLH